METLRVKVAAKRAEALLEQLQGPGVIEIEDNGASLEALAKAMKRIRAGVKSKMTVKEVMAAATSRAPSSPLATSASGGVPRRVMRSSLGSAS